MERVWGGRRLESEFGKKLPAQRSIGESWEIVDRPEAQSIVRNGPLRGKTLHELWTKYRDEMFGHVADSARFPLLVKLLDAHDKLSLQVHPPEKFAKKLGGESKTEFWYVAAADVGAEVYLGFRESITRDQFKKTLRQGTAADHVHKIRVKAGDAVFLPAGRLHALGAGNLLIKFSRTVTPRIGCSIGIVWTIKACAVNCMSTKRCNASISTMFGHDYYIPKANCCCITACLRFRSGISTHLARSRLARSSQSAVVSPALQTALRSILHLESFSWFQLSSATGK